MQTEISNSTNKVINTAQIGGIETAVLDNGSARGNRIAWFNTGAGLRFKVALDRGMDISEAFFNQHSLAWLSHNGFTAPQPGNDRGIEWLKTFGGGLLTTCGLSHVGGPETDEFGERGVHGRFSNTSAEIISVVQPDIHRGEFKMSITGIIKESTLFGPNLELKRTISCTLGESKISIHDEVINKANTPSPLMLLYHFNLGYPLVDEGSKINWQGEWKPRDPNPEIFVIDGDYKTCKAPLESHKGSHEEVALIDPETDENGNCTCGISNPKLNLNFEIKFIKEQLPCLSNWQHWGEREYVTGLEPGTNFPIGQKKAREDGSLTFLEPLEKKNINIELNISTL